jgi:hypothetical protein
MVLSDPRRPGPRCRPVYVAQIVQGLFGDWTVMCEWGPARMRCRLAADGCQQKTPPGWPWRGFPALVSGVAIARKNEI